VVILKPLLQSYCWQPIAVFTVNIWFINFLLTPNFLSIKQSLWPTVSVANSALLAALDGLQTPAVGQETLISPNWQHNLANKPNPAVDDSIRFIFAEFSWVRPVRFFLFCGVCSAFSLRFVFVDFNFSSREWVLFLFVSVLLRWGSVISISTAVFRVVPLIQFILCAPLHLNRWAISLSNAPVIALIELSSLSLIAIAIFNRIRNPASQFAIRLRSIRIPKDTKIQSQQSLIDNIGKTSTIRVIELSAKCDMKWS